MLTREKFVPYLQMIAEIQHISGPTWSEHDVMSLIKTQNDFVNNPLACPITRAKWGTKSNQAILKNLERIRTSENMYLQRYFRVDPETWSKPQPFRTEGSVEPRGGRGAKIVDDEAELGADRRCEVGAERDVCTRIDKRDRRVGSGRGMISTFWRQFEPYFPFFSTNSCHN